MKKQTVRYLWAIIAMVTITIFILRRFVYRPDWIFLTLTLTASAEVPAGKYYVKSSTHSWFLVDYTETVATGYMQEKTSDHYEGYDWYYELRYKGGQAVTLRMSNHDCTGVGEIIHEAKYIVSGNTVTFVFTNGKQMVMERKAKKN